MIRLVFLILMVLIGESSFPQTTIHLVGTWTMVFMRQPNGDSCPLPKSTGKIIFRADGGYKWEENGDIVEGKWQLQADRLKLYHSRPVNFAGTEADHIYRIEKRNGYLIIHEPIGGDISCPILYFRM